MALRKAAFVDLGAVESRGGGCAVEIAWRSSNLAPLFPVFAGHLTVGSGRLLVEGCYAPPGGEIGLILDRALLGVVARRTAVWLLGVVGDALAAHVSAPELLASGPPWTGSVGPNLRRRARPARS